MTEELTSPLSSSIGTNPFDTPAAQLTNRNDDAPEEQSKATSEDELDNKEVESYSKEGHRTAVDSISSATSNSSAVTVVPNGTGNRTNRRASRTSRHSISVWNSPALEADQLAQSESTLPEIPLPKSGKDRRKSSPGGMKKFNAYLPKFKSNKLQPLNVEGSSTAVRAFDADSEITSLSVAGTSGGSATGSASKVKASSSKTTKKLKRSKKGAGKKSKIQTETTINIDQPIEQTQPLVQIPSTSALIIPENAGNSTEGGGDGVTPNIHIIEVDADQLRRTSKVIFAVPQYPGQPVIPIAYKLSNRRRDSSQNGDRGPSSANNYQPGNLMNGMHFEVVWRNIIYYHKATLKKLKEVQAAEKKKTAKKGGTRDPKGVSNGTTTTTTSKGGKKKGKDPAPGFMPPVPGSTLTSTIPRNGQPRPTLNNISGSFRSGQMTAIMGPSGAGKTVFLNIITGHLSINSQKENSGDILINGVRSIRIGFVEQFDHLLPHLTVRETLLFASKIKNAARYYLNHMKIIDNVLSRLDLEDASEIYCSRCSNGQRKRLSIAIEMCFNSDILILDEPSTGLDAVTGFQIMNTLKGLTKRRRAISILATIHQPSPRMFELFDNLVVLSREGTIMYQGSPADLPQTLLLVGLQAPLYTNLSDFLLEVASGDFGRQTLHLLAHYNAEYNQMRIAEDLNEVEATSLQEAVRVANSVNKRSFVLCTWLLFIRTVVCNLRNPFNTQIRFGSLFFCAFFMSVLFTDIVGTVSTCPPTKYFLWRYGMDEILVETDRQQQHVQENLAVIFMMALISTFNSMLNTVVTFPEELAVFRREYDNYSYSIFCFYIAKILGDVPFTIPSTTMFVVAMHRFTGQIFDTWSRLWLVVLPCCMVTFIGQLVGMTIGCIFAENIFASVFSIIFMIIPLIMFSGFFRLIKDMTWIMAKLSWCSFIKQVINSMMIAIYGLGRCEVEDEEEKAAFVAKNISEAEARPRWITSMTTLIDYQLTLSETEDPNMLALKNESMEAEAKLVRYMGLNTGGETSEGAIKTALVLQHFNLKSNMEAYWTEIYYLLDYTVFFAILLYVVMVLRYGRRN